MTGLEGIDGNSEVAIRPNRSDPSTYFIAMIILYEVQQDTVCGGSLETDRILKRFGIWEQVWVMWRQQWHYEADSWVSTPIFHPLPAPTNVALFHWLRSQQTQGFPKPSDITAQLIGGTKDPAEKMPSIYKP